MAAAKRSTLIAFCRSLPHATEDIKWGADLVFSIGGKMFAAFDNNGTDATFGCKVAEEEFAAITSIHGIIPAPYAARFHWIRIEDPKVLPEKEALAFLRGSYDLVLAKVPQKLQRLIAEGQGGAKAKAKAGANAKAKAKAKARRR